MRNVGEVIGRFRVLKVGMRRVYDNSDCTSRSLISSIVAKAPRISSQVSRSLLLIEMLASCPR